MLCRLFFTNLRRKGFPLSGYRQCWVLVRVGGISLGKVGRGLVSFPDPRKLRICERDYSRGWASLVSFPDPTKGGLVGSGNETRASWCLAVLHAVGRPSELSDMGNERSHLHKRKEDSAADAGGKVKAKAQSGIKVN